MFWYFLMMLYWKEVPEFQIRSWIKLRSYLPIRNKKIARSRIDRHISWFTEALVVVARFEFRAQLQKLLSFWRELEHLKMLVESFKAHSSQQMSSTDSDFKLSSL